MDPSGPGGHSSGRSVPGLHGADVVVPPRAFLPVVLLRACGKPQVLAGGNHPLKWALLDVPSFCILPFGLQEAVVLVHVLNPSGIGLPPGIVLAYGVLPELHALPEALLLVPALQEHLLVEALVSNLRGWLWRVGGVFALGWDVILRLRRLLGFLVMDRLLLLLVILAGDLA